ncbi:MAG: DUF1538 domain-containing protein [Cryomorphaceae bacterium]|nr:DUF1538 domain-containing protein [Cryomorphaceae bacterium]
MNSFTQFTDVFLSTIIDVLPIAALLVLFQVFVVKQKIHNVKKMILGFVLVIFGLAIFLLGLEKALFPIGKTMAQQLASEGFLEKWSDNPTHWSSYYWMYIFAALIGFSSTIAEPALVAVAIKAEEVSDKTLSQKGLRYTVAVGVSVALALGTFRIITGTPLFYYILAGYATVIILTIFAPKKLIALAYDSGGVTTSTVTVPIVAAMGLGLSSMIPGRNPAIDGFGLIAFANIFPMISVLGYAQIKSIIKKWKSKNRNLSKKQIP